MKEIAKFLTIVTVIFALSPFAANGGPPEDSSARGGSATGGDSDGIPDEVELRLGTDPNAAEKLEVVWENTGPLREVRERCRDIRRILLANVAANRWLWALEFAADYEFKNTNLTLFVDADNNPKHGRKDKLLMGADFVIWLSDGGRACHGYSIPGEGAAPAPTRFAWLGKRVYICTDMSLAQENGKSHCRAFARCETLDPRTEISSTGWFALTAPAESDRPKPVVVTVGTPRRDSKDSDGDGIPDWAEVRLGTDPKTSERLDVIYDYAKALDAAGQKKKLALPPERRIERISFGNVAGDRFLWCVDFGADYPEAASHFILYLDADNNPKTGRKDMPGVDYMLVAAGGNPSVVAFSPTGENVAGPPNRVATVGKRLYFCADAPLKQEGGRSVYRATGLSETRDPVKAVDSTSWFAAKGAGVTDRRKAFGLDDCVANENVEVTRGLDLFRALKADPANAVVKIGNCSFEGFEDDLRSEYKEPSAVRTAPGGKIFVTAPRDGRFHFGFLLYDQAGTEKVEIRRGDTRLGIAVADEDDNRTKLFFTKEALDFKAGDTIELRTALASGSYRIEDILFLAKRPEIRPRIFELSDLAVTPVWEGDAVKPRTVRVTWISTWPTKCTIQYGEKRKGVSAYAEPSWQQIAGKEEFANHRVYLDGLRLATTYRLRVIAPKPKGGELTSETITFRTAPRAVKAATKRSAVPLKVQNPSSGALSAWPVTSGIPFPKGALDASPHIRLLGPDGKVRSLQAQSLARWPDGSVKWVLLSFRADAPAAGSAIYTLEYGSKVRQAIPKTGLVVEEKPDRVAITTGPMRIELLRSQLTLPGKVWIDRNGDERFTEDELVSGGGVGRLADDSGKEFTTLGPVEELVVEERGPERACVLVKGHHVAKDGAKLFAYEGRIFAYADQKFVRLFYTFGNDVLNSEFTSVRSLYLAVPLEGGASGFRLGTDPPIPSGPAHALSILQDFDDHYSLSWDGQKQEGKRAPGWAGLDGPKGAMTVAVRDFWKLYPKSIGVDPSGTIKVGLMPALKEDQYAEQAKDPAQLVHLYYNLLGGRYKIKQGQAKTHEFLIAFAGAPSQVGAEKDYAVEQLRNVPEDRSQVTLDAFQQGVMATAPSDWVCGSLALGEIPSTGTAWSTRYDKQMAKAIENYVKTRDSRHDYGIMNYGDWWGERGFNWANNEYDDEHVWLVQFARTGDMRAFTVGDRGAKHYADVDCIHYSSDPRRVGAGYSHCLGHVGGYFKTNPVEGGTLGGGHSPCHTRTEGLVEHYLLTGDRRSFETARGIADRYDSWYLNNYDFANCRVPGWHIILTTSLYNATADPFYLNAAKIIARRAIERQAPGGGWQRCLVPGHCFCLPRHRGEAGFMVGVLLSGLKYYHQATADQRAADAIVGGARYLARETYDSATHQFRYTTCPNSSKPSGTGYLGCEGFAYAARLTNAPDLVKLTRDVMSDVISRVSGGGAASIRFVPRAVWDLDRLGPSQYVLASRTDFEVLALNSAGEDFVVRVEPSDAKVEVVGPSGKKKTVFLKDIGGFLVGSDGEKGVYRGRVKGATRVATSLDDEALAVPKGVRIKSNGFLRLAFSAPPKMGEEGAVMLKAQADGEHTARLIAPDGHEAAALKWRGGFFSSVVTLKIPPMALRNAPEGVPCELEIRGPAGEVEVRLGGLPPYISAPSGKFFCPGKPITAFSFSSLMLPGNKPEIVLDASRSTDVDDDIVEYVWKFDDGSEVKGRQATVGAARKPPTPDATRDSARSVTLEVRDKWGFSDSCTQGIIAAPAWLLALDPNAIAFAEAEDFCKQGLGEVRLFVRPGTSGRLITYWHEVIGHWLEWKVNVPRTGEYKIILKYATQCNDTQRDLKIDGAYPSDAFKRFHLPNTGGFCAEKDDWAYYTIGGAKDPASVCLAAGTHTIRMTNLKDGCALDFILLVPK